MSDPADPHLSGAAAIRRVAGVIAVFIAVAVTQLVAGIAIVLAYPESMRVPGEFPPGLLVVSAAMTTTVFLAAALAMGAFAAPGIGRALRMVRPAGGWATIALAVIAFIPLSYTIDTLLQFTGWGEASLIGMMARSIGQARGWTLVMAVIFIGLGAGFAEECFFRGYMQTWLRPVWGAGPAILASSGAFALMHLDPVHTPVAFVFGLLLGWIVEKTGSLVPAVAAHVVNNVVSVVLTAVQVPLAPVVRSVLVPVGLAAAIAALLRLRRPAGRIAAGTGSG